MKVTKNLKIILIALFILIMLVPFVLDPRSLDFLAKGNHELFSDLSLINGINTTRGYGLKLGLNQSIVKILFNKSIYLVVFPLRFISFLFQLFIAGVSILLFGHV